MILWSILIVQEDKLRNLLTADDKKSLTSENVKVDKTLKAMQDICESLAVPTQKYRPKNTFEIIVNYVNETEKLERMLYSEISNYIFSLDEGDRGILVVNMAHLLEFALNDYELEQFELENAHDCKKIVVKLYDHSQLAIHQIENAKKIHEKSIEETKSDFSREIKKIERDYVTILGIFTSIVLAFVGGITFSSAVLENISNASIFRVLIVVDFLAFILINASAFLIKLLTRINGIEDLHLDLKTFNKVFIGIACLIVISWLISLNELPIFLGQYIPWKN